MICYKNFKTRWRNVTACTITVLYCVACVGSLPNKYILVPRPLSLPPFVSVSKGPTIRPCCAPKSLP